LTAFLASTLAFLLPNFAGESTLTSELMGLYKRAFTSAGVLLLSSLLLIIALSGSALLAGSLPLFAQLLLRITLSFAFCSRRPFFNLAA
jgi:hypothetical protein